MKIKKLKNIKWKIKRFIKKKIKDSKNCIFVRKVKKIKEYYDYKNNFLRRDKNILKKCNIKRSEKYYHPDFFRIHNKVLHSKLYFGFISRLCDPYPRLNNIELEEYLRKNDYVYSTQILARYNSRYIFDSYVWKKNPYKCMKIKSDYNHKNIIVKKIILPSFKKIDNNPQLYYYIFYMRNNNNSGPVLVGFYKKMDICIMMDCRFDKSFIKMKYQKRENKEILFFNEIINFVRKDYKGKIILHDYKNDLHIKKNTYDPFKKYEHFSINYSKKYGISWYESKLGFIKKYGEEYYLE